MMFAGGVLVAYGAAYVVQGIVSALSTRIPPWLAYVPTSVAIALGCGAAQDRSPPGQEPGRDLWIGG